MFTVLRNFIRPKKEKALNSLNLEQIETIVQSYGQCMISNPTNNILRNARELPYPKEIIKKALLMAIKLTENIQMREQLKSGYLMLADFQENVPDDIGISFKKLDSSIPTEKLALQVLNSLEVEKLFRLQCDKEFQELSKDLEGI